MAFNWLYYFSSLLSLSVAIGPTGDLTCNQESWTVVAADWLFKSQCVFENTNDQNGAMSWIGEQMPESLGWTDYTVEMSMTPTDFTAGGANGGLAFLIQDVGEGPNSGHYYAISLFPDYGDENSITVHLGKWNNNYQTANEWEHEDKWTPGHTFLIKAVISTRVNVAVDVYVDNIFLGTFRETEEPMYRNGSIGMRNYRLPAQFTSICVNGCNVPDDGSIGNGGWIFIGILCGALFLYFMIGYMINAFKSKQYGDITGNIPHFQFWKTLPRLVIVGCQVSVEIMKGVLCKKVGDNESLMETAQEYDPDDQEL